MIDLNLKSINLPIRISLFVCIPSLAVLLYFLNKKKPDQEEDESYDEMIRSRSSLVEVKVPSDCVRGIIGPQGCIIKEIQRLTNTRINFKDKNMSTTDDDSDKTLVIRGSNINIQHAELEIKKLILDMPMVLVEEYYVPDYACGKIIGRGGSSIKEISKTSNCKIKLTDRMYSQKKTKNNGKLITQITESSSTETINRSQTKIVTLSGSNEEILSAKDLIIAKIKEEDANREKRNKNNRHKQTNSNNDTNYREAQSQPVSSSTSFETNKDMPINNETEETEINVRLMDLPKVQELEPYLKNNTVDIFVSAVAHPQAFWVQVISESSVKLEKLLQEMNEIYENNSQYSFKNIEELKIGQMVAGNFNGESWHRAEIKGFKSKKNSQNQMDKLIDVYYVDFGDSAYLDIKEIRKLPENFYELPLQAIECSLADVELNELDEYWQEDVINEFEDIVHSCKWKPLQMKLVKKNSPRLLVTLYDKAKGSCITEVLVKKGHCKSLNSESKLIDHDQTEPEAKTLQ